MKIAFSGPSGLGKSTLCKYVSEEFQIPWLSTSAGDILSKKDKDKLKETYGYSGSGHKNVINLSSVSPSFGLDFQWAVLEARKEQINKNSNLVIDRCPIDNVAYMLAQNSHNGISENLIESFIRKAQDTFMNLDVVFQIRYSPDIPFIEDNSSRVANRYFQQYMSDVFVGVYARYFSNLVGPQVHVIDFWPLRDRKEFVKYALGL